MELNSRIIEEYSAGKSISQLAKEYPISYGKIQTLLRENNVPIRGGRKKVTLSEEELKKLEQLYTSNEKTMKELKVIFGRAEETLLRIIKEHGWERKNHNRVNKRIISDYFSVIDSPNKAYWIGLLLTDGSVNKDIKGNRQGRIRLQLKR